MDRCRLAFRGRSSQPTTTFMSPSSIHHLHAELAVAGLSSDLTKAVGSTCDDAARLRVQAVEKDGCWFALDSAQLELCRRLERGGVCRQVRVDVVPCGELPVNVRNLIKPPPCLATTTTTTAASSVSVASTTPATTSSTCSVTSLQTVTSSVPTRTANNDVKAAASQQQGQVRAGHVTKGYHQLQQEDSLQPPTSDSDRGSRSGSASDELELDSDINSSDDDDDELSDGDWTDVSDDVSIDSAEATTSGDERDCLI